MTKQQIHKIIVTLATAIVTSCTIVTKTIEQYDASKKL